MWLVPQPMWILLCHQTLLTLALQFSPCPVMFNGCVATLCAVADHGLHVCLFALCRAASSSRASAAATGATPTR